MRILASTQVAYAVGLIVTLLHSEPCAAQSPNEESLFEMLTQDNERKQGLAKVLKAPETFSSVILYFGAQAALGEQRLEDSCYLFYAGHIRARFDKACFPPNGEGADSPFTALGAVSASLGPAVEQAAWKEPITYAKAIERVNQFHPQVPENYDPGYEFKKKRTTKEAASETQGDRIAFLKQLNDFSSLLKNEDYFKAFTIVQAYRNRNANGHPTRDEFERAMQAIGKVEKATGLKGIIK